MSAFDLPGSALRGLASGSLGWKAAISSVPIGLERTPHFFFKAASAFLSIFASSPFDMRPALTA